MAWWPAPTQEPPRVTWWEPKMLLVLYRLGSHKGFRNFVPGTRGRDCICVFYCLPLVCRTALDQVASRGQEVWNRLPSQLPLLFNLSHFLLVERLLQGLRPEILKSSPFTPLSLPLSLTSSLSTSLTVSSFEISLRLAPFLSQSWSLDDRGRSSLVLHLLV